MRKRAGPLTPHPPKWGAWSGMSHWQSHQPTIGNQRGTSGNPKATLGLTYMIIHQRKNDR